MKIPRWNQSGGGYSDSEMKVKPISESQSQFVTGFRLCARHGTNLAGVRPVTGDKLKPKGQPGLSEGDSRNRKGGVGCIRKEPVQTHILLNQRTDGNWELFFSAEGWIREFRQVLKEVKSYISCKYATLITDGDIITDNCQDSSPRERRSMLAAVKWRKKLSVEMPLLDQSLKREKIGYQLREEL
ncbi:MAG: hypothetical protein F8N38_21135 [Hungatella sp.]|nr:hypothetical protein [Hungatella sp.]